MFQLLFGQSFMQFLPGFTWAKLIAFLLQQIRRNFYG